MLDRRQKDQEEVDLENCFNDLKGNVEQSNVKVTDD